MSNVLTLVSEALGIPGVLEGTLPDKPDTVIALFEYPGSPPTQFFGSVAYTYNVQVRARATDPLEAYALAVQAQERLSNFENSVMVIKQISSILGIGRDSHNPPRDEYTINFQIFMK